MSGEDVMEERLVNKDNNPQWQDEPEQLAGPSSPEVPPPGSEPAQVILKPSRAGCCRFLPAQLLDNLPSLSHAMPSIFRCEKTPEPLPPV
ncbi:hypothetical protein BDP27DRAFT_1429321 [Rhodocollybia butyracea]|uniref:Uncharacterized protein n=1 Tax=Rhodocollybia butyracea TaxID=206335 RepID=A0A9P5PD25_9AGAR|nr:hypothetical protein BDP27DRAFT_1429321 [Rhodocollybia butyracea]